MQAVYSSNLERPLRFLAVTLAWFADDDGRRVYPGVERLAEMLGCRERQVRSGLDRLRRLGVLCVESATVPGKDGVPRPAGGWGCTARYRFNLDALDRLSPATTLQCSAGFRSRTTTKSEAPVRGTLQSAVPNPAIDGTKPCSPASETLQPTAEDPYRDPSGDPSESVHPTRADARACAPTDQGDEQQRTAEMLRATFAEIKARGPLPRSRRRS
jgi:hypothetical protein